MSRNDSTKLGALIPCVAIAFLSLVVAGACSSNEPARDGAAGAQAAAGIGGGSTAGSSGGGAGSGTSGLGGAAASGGTSSGAGSAGAGGSGGSAGAGAGAGTDGGRDATGGGGMAGGSGTAGAASGAGGGGPSNQPPSCATSGPGRTTCGENEAESCCTSLPIPGGSFSRTYENTGSGATGLADAATVSSLRMDKYEITVGRFREYVKYLSEGGAAPSAGSGKHSHLNGGNGLADSASSGAFEPGWDTSWNADIPSGSGATAQWNTQLDCNSFASWTDDPGANELLPLTCLNWYESYAFCIWDGGFLPSEAEWRYAAAGGDEQRMYPWGSTNPGTESEYAIYDCCYPDQECRATSGMDCAGIVNAAPVGFASLGAGRYGQLDLSGSVFEWLVDRFANYAGACADCANLSASSENRALPGGGFRTTLMPYLLSSNRSAISYAPTFRGDFAVGARCARVP